MRRLFGAGWALTVEIWDFFLFSLVWGLGLGVMVHVITEFVLFQGGFIIYHFILFLVILVFISGFVSVSRLFPFLAFWLSSHYRMIMIVYYIELSQNNIEDWHT